MPPTAFTTDTLAAEALAILAAAGKTDFTVGVTDTRLPDGHHAFYINVHNCLGSEHMVYQDSPEAALKALAAYAGVAYPLEPVQYMTAQQHEDLIRLYNHPEVSRAEKTKMLLSINTYTYAQAEQMLADGVGSFRQEIRRREAARRGLTVSSEVFTVASLAA